MDENVILQLFIAFKDDLLPGDKRSPQEICEAYKHFREVAKQVFADYTTPVVKHVRRKRDL